MPPQTAPQPPAVTTPPPFTGTITFAAGETTKTVSVTIIDDTVDDDTETLTLSLSGASNAAIGDGQATGTITNTETPADPLTASFSTCQPATTGAAKLKPR